MRAHRMRCDRPTHRRLRPCSPRPHSQLPSLLALPQVRLLGPGSTAATPRTTCSSTASTSALTRMRSFAASWRVTTAPQSDGRPSQVADGQPVGRHLRTAVDFTLYYYC